MRRPEDSGFCAPEGWKPPGPFVPRLPHRCDNPSTDIEIELLILKLLLRLVGVQVTAEDELESTAQRYLSAALQLQRPPNRCAPDRVEAARCSS